MLLKLITLQNQHRHEILPDKKNAPQNSQWWSQVMTSYTYWHVASPSLYVSYSSIKTYSTTPRVLVSVGHRRALPHVTLFYYSPPFSTHDKTRAYLSTCLPRWTHPIPASNNRKKHQPDKYAYILKCTTYITHMQHTAAVAKLLNRSHNSSGFCLNAQENSTEVRTLRRGKLYSSRAMHTPLCISKPWRHSCKAHVVYMNI